MIERWDVEPVRRSRRGLDERIVVTAPWLVRIAAPPVLRARAGSPIRRSLLGRVLHMGIAQTNRRDYDAMSVFLSPDVGLDMYPDAPEARPAGLEAAYRGRDGYVKALTDWTAPFEDFRWELRELIDAGGDRIGARLDMGGRGAGSGIETQMTQYIVWQLGRGRLQRQWVLQGEAAALGLLSEA